MTGIAYSFMPAFHKCNLGMPRLAWLNNFYLPEINPGASIQALVSIRAARSRPERFTALLQGNSGRYE
jgi:hypothetical protein